MLKGSSSNFGWFMMAYSWNSTWILRQMHFPWTNTIVSIIWANIQLMPVVRSPVNPLIILLFVNVQHLYCKINFEIIWAKDIKVILLTRCKFPGWRMVFKLRYLSPIPHLFWGTSLYMPNPWKYYHSLPQTQDNKGKWTRNECCS